MIRIGHGYDSHRFQAGRELILGGLRIDHTSGLAGHSDADAVLHALTDAMLGSIAAGDIGQLFPPGDPQWKDADSAIFLTEARDRLRKRNARLVNCDITVIAEQPRLGPHIPEMRQRIARLLELPVDRVSIKAKTSESMGALGRCEGLAAWAAVLVETD
jgi:2-C-methyl-D-erythritol 2,4-cyclodiphosphate synthase